MIEKSPNVQHIMPFIIKNIEANYEAIVFNGALKKNLYVMIIDALFNNELIKIDFHVRPAHQKHIIIKILVTFITSNKLSLNLNSDDLILRQNAARMLAKIVARYARMTQQRQHELPEAEAQPVHAADEEADDAAAPQREVGQLLDHIRHPQSTPR